MDRYSDDKLSSQSSKTLLISSAVPTDLPHSDTTILPGALSSDHPPASQTLLISSAVPTDAPPVNVYSLLDEAVPVKEQSQVSKTLLILDSIPTDPPYTYTTLLKDDYAG